MKKHRLVLIALISLAAIAFSGCSKREASSASASSPTDAASGSSDSQASTGSASGASGGKTISTTPPFPDGRRTSFQDVVSQLDPGGSLFLYLATDQWLAGLSTNLAELQQSFAGLAGPAERDHLDKAFTIVTGLVRSSGLEDATGVGISAAPVAPGLYRNKFIVHHPAGAGRGFLWSMFGSAPHALTGQSMLPSNTVAAAFGDLNIKPLWESLEREVGRSGIPELQDAIRSWPMMFEKQTKIPWPQLLGSLAGEAGILLTLDDSQTVELPMGGRMRIAIPAPGLLIAVKVNDSLLFDRLRTDMQANPKATSTEEGGIKICSMPFPAPFPIELTVASVDDYLYLASSPELVRTVQAVRQGRQTGLKSSSEFADLARHVPAQGNQFVYVGKRFSETFGDIQRQAMGAGGMPTEQLEVLQRVLGDPAASFSLTVGGHTAAGWQTVSVGNKDSATTAVLAPTVGVTAVAAGLLLPALAKAKAKAQTISTVSNLKQLGLAARMYANDNDQKFPKAQSWGDDLKQYLGSTKVYKAPNDPTPRACSFAFNAKLSGLNEAKIHPSTVLFFETDDGDWNQSGGVEMMVDRPRPGAMYVIGLADGSVQQVPQSRLSSLRWDP